MRTSYQIYCDYRRAISKASQLETLATTIRYVGRRYVSEEIETLSQKWQRDPINIVRGKGNEIYSGLISEADRLKSLATTIRRIATRNYNAEMRALELARTRSSSN